LLIAFISLFVIFRHRAIENANIVKQRAGKANKVAVKRLKKAAKLTKAGKDGEFYDEVLRALWGYVGDKLNMPVDKLTRDNIREQLLVYSVSDETINQFIGALDECEFARYAPGDATGNMNKVYDAAITAITQIAATMKKSAKNNKPLAVVLLLLLSTLTASAATVTKADADSLYAAEHYQQAAHSYEALLKQGVSSDLYYNLGNCYYRMDDMTRAVLNYERALLLSPGDRDVRLNLQMARSKTIDKIVPESEMFFVTWYHSLVNLMSVDGWARMALISLVAAIILALAYLFSDRIWLRKLGFFAGLLFLVVFALSNLFAYQQKHQHAEHRGAVVVTPSVGVKRTPDQQGKDGFVIHEGTRVNITDTSIKSWLGVRLDDGREGWIHASAVELI
jgi:tetratricopeptide (TPR) repeat protein